jgi:hypothetical protein
MDTFKAAANDFKAHATKISELAKKQKPESQHQLLAIAEAYMHHAEKLLETGRKLHP